MKRNGKCKRCGNCCIGQKLLPGLPIKLICPFLFIGKDNIAICRQYNDRPQFCRDYPAEPADIIKECGFYFGEKKV